MRDRTQQSWIATTRLLALAVWIFGGSWANAVDLPLLREDHPDEEFDGAEARVVTCAATVPGATATGGGILDRGRTFAAAVDSVSAIAGNDAGSTSIGTSQNITTPPATIDHHPTLSSEFLGQGSGMGTFALAWQGGGFTRGIFELLPHPTDPSIEWGMLHIDVNAELSDTTDGVPSTGASSTAAGISDYDSGLPLGSVDVVSNRSNATTSVRIFGQVVHSFTSHGGGGARFFFDVPVPVGIRLDGGSGGGTDVTMTNGGTDAATTTGISHVSFHVTPLIVPEGEDPPLARIHRIEEDAEGNIIAYILIWEGAPPGGEEGEGGGE